MKMLPEEMHGQAQAAAPTRRQQKADYENNKLHKRLARLVGQAISDFNMIEEGDRVMVCVSGGKDSYALLEILMRLRERAPIHFDIVAVNLDQKQPGFPEHVLPQYLSALGIPYHIENQDTYSIVKRLIPEGKTTCSLCSRLRRGILYRVADELGATKIALGHHRDDILETLFLNLFYAAKMKGMPAKLQSDDGRHIVIRPLAYVKEVDLERYAELREYPIIPCTLCGSQPNLKRAEMKVLIRDWEKRYPGRIESLFNAMSNVVPSHLMDRSLHPFTELRATGVADANGDLAFDEASDDSACASTSLASALGASATAASDDSSAASGPGSVARSTAASPGEAVIRFDRSFNRLND
jgi:tRNA 2-thiocytidine biosynthesis protein TtcA